MNWDGATNEAKGRSGETAGSLSLADSRYIDPTTLASSRLLEGESLALHIHGLKYPLT
jgi:hypothetical protein